MPDFLDWRAAGVVAAVLFAAFTQGFAGFGFGILAMAQMSLFVPGMERASVVVSLVSLVVACATMAMDREAGRVDWKGYCLLAPGTLLGVPLGYRFLEAFGGSALFQAVFGVVLIGFGWNGLARPHLHRPAPLWLAGPMGLASGMISGAACSGGPPLVIYLYSRVADPRMARSTLALLFATSSLWRVVSVHFGPRPVDGPVLAWAGLLAVPAIVVAAWAHVWSRRFSARAFTMAVSVVLAGIGLLQLAGALSAG